MRPALDFKPSLTNVPADLSNVVAIACGGDHNLVLKADGTVYAWSLDYSGQTNVPADLSNVVAIAAGFSSSFAVRTDGSRGSVFRPQCGTTTGPAPAPPAQGLPASRSARKSSYAPRSFHFAATLTGRACGSMTVKPSLVTRRLSFSITHWSGPMAR